MEETICLIFIQHCPYPRNTAPGVHLPSVQALGVIGFVTLILPARWLAKIVYFVLGFAFWHVPPILVALPAGDHRR